MYIAEINHLFCYFREEYFSQSEWSISLNSRDAAFKSSQKYQKYHLKAVFPNCRWYKSCDIVFGMQMMEIQFSLRYFRSIMS